jgi:integrase
LNVESVKKGRRTKSGKSRRVPITPRLADAFREHMAAFRLRTYHGARTEWVFHHDIDRRHAKAGERLASLRACSPEP